MRVGSEAVDQRRERSPQGLAGHSTCPKCQTGNLNDAQFCCGCGISLWEKCSGCAGRVRIGERFCRNCGYNNAERFNALYEQRCSSLEQARRLAAEHSLDQASALLRRLTGAPDYRFEELAAEAQQLLAQVESQHASWREKAEAASEAARAAMEQHDHAAVLRHLGPIPRSVLTEDALGMLRHARAAVEQWHQLKAALKTAIEKKRYTETGPIFDRLLVLRPDAAKYETLAKQIADQLLGSAERKFRRGEFSAANEQLAGVALCCRGPQHAALNARIEEIFWLREQVIKSPFATPTLLQLTARLCRLAPADGRTPLVLEKQKTRLASHAPSARPAFPHWQKSCRASPPHEIEAFGRFQNIGCLDQGPFSKDPHRFAIALGLALQGVGIAAYDVRLADTQLRQKRTGFRKFFQKQAEANRAWGLDIGASSIKATCVEKGAGGEAQVVASDYVAFEAPLHRPEMDVCESQAVRAALEQLKEKHDLGSIPVWIGLPTRQTLVRYSQLPPVYDKKNDAMILAEAEHQFPVGLQELAWDAWVAPFRPGSQQPRSLVLVATRAATLMERIELLRAIGIDIAGVQSTALAFANALRFEFRDLVPELDLESDEQPPAPAALAGLDVGCETTSLVVTSPSGLWFRALDVSGDDITVAISRALNLPYTAAAQVQAEFAKADRPAEIYRHVTPVLQKLWGRTFSEVAKARDALGGCHVDQLWAFGGPTRMHGFFDPTLESTDASPDRARAALGDEQDAIVTHKRK